MSIQGAIFRGGGGSFYFFKGTLATLDLASAFIGFWAGFMLEGFGFWWGYIVKDWVLIFMLMVFIFMLSVSLLPIDLHASFTLAARFFFLYA